MSQSTQDPKRRQRQTMFLYAIIAMFVVYVLSSVLSPQMMSATKEVSYSDFLGMVDDKIGRAHV